MSFRVETAWNNSVQLTNYHAKYIAYELTRRFPPDSAEKLAGAVASAQGLRSAG